jgi:hypothetical protein
MLKKDCKTGIRVAWKSTEVPFQRGKIVGDPTATTVVVEWDTGTISRSHLINLLLETDALEQEKRIREERARLEGQWKETQRQISSNLKEATTLVQEAVDLLSKAGTGRHLIDFNEFQDLLNEFQDLSYLVREKNGWDSSAC